LWQLQVVGFWVAITLIVHVEVVMALKGTIGAERNYGVAVLEAIFALARVLFCLNVVAHETLSPVFYYLVGRKCW
jgi:hypothetical protein